MKRHRSDSSVEEQIIPTKKVHVQSSNQTDTNPARWKYPPPSQVEGESSEVTFTRQEETSNQNLNQSEEPTTNPDNPRNIETRATNEDNPSEMEIDMIEKPRLKTTKVNQKKTKWFPLKKFKPFQQKKKGK